jgi:hypothetical protein
MEGVVRVDGWMVWFWWGLFNGGGLVRGEFNFLAFGVTEAESEQRH